VWEILGSSTLNSTVRGLRDERESKGHHIAKPKKAVKWGREQGNWEHGQNFKGGHKPIKDLT